MRNFYIYNICELCRINFLKTAINFYVRFNLNYLSIQNKIQNVHPFNLFYKAKLLYAYIIKDSLSFRHDFLKIWFSS